jgi:hypothetical protein
MVLDRTVGRAAVEAVVTVQSNQEVAQLSDDELLAMIAAQQAARAKDEERGTLQ